MRIDSNYCLVDKSTIPSDAINILGQDTFSHQLAQAVCASFVQMCQITNDIQGKIERFVVNFNADIPADDWYYDHHCCTYFLFKG